MGYESIALPIELFWYKREVEKIYFAIIYFKEVFYH